MSSSSVFFSLSSSSFSFNLFSLFSLSLFLPFFLQACIVLSFPPTVMADCRALTQALRADASTKNKNARQARCSATHRQSRGPARLPKHAGAGWTAPHAMAPPSLPPGEL